MNFKALRTIVRISLIDSCTKFNDIACVGDVFLERPFGGRVCFN